MKGEIRHRKEELGKEWVTRCRVFTTIQGTSHTFLIFNPLHLPVVSHKHTYFLHKHIPESRNYFNYPSAQFSSVTQSCPTLCGPMNRRTPGLTVHHQLPEFTQIHVHRVSDAIQPSHPLSSPSPPAPNPSQHQSLFQ